MLKQTESGYSNLYRFLRFAGWELLIAGLLTIGMALLQGFRNTALLAFGFVIAGAVSLTSPSILKGNEKSFSGVLPVLYGKSGPLLFLAIPLVLSIFLFSRNPNMEALAVIDILIACLWLIGLEALLFFQTEVTQDPPEKNKSLNHWTVISLLFAYGILLIPSRIPSLLNGIPWNTPLEFIFAALLLPVAFIAGHAFFGKRRIAVLLALLFAAKLLLAFFLPQSGLGIRVYTSMDAYDAGQWQRGYESILWPSYTQVAQSPYQSLREFPVEWINYHTFTKDSFWLALELDGAVSLQENERLVFVVQGAQAPQILLHDIRTQTSSPAVIVGSASDLIPQLYNEISYAQQAEIEGTLVFPKYGEFRFEPMIVSSDGSLRSALSDIWLSSSALGLDRTVFHFGINGIGLVLMALILASLFDGMTSLYRSGKLNVIDLYLAETGLVLFYFVGVADKTDVNISIICLTVLLALTKLFDISIRPRVYSSIGYFFAIGIPVLLMLLAFDIHHLQSVVVLPPFQDSMEYQMLARNIYVSGDVFLLQTPPWSYKVLFPYVIGFLHLLFGQSMSAQLFLNAWCAVLSLLLMADLSMYFGLSKRISFVTSTSFLFLVLIPVSFIFYFRFGLIEPVAISTLLAVGYFAKERKYPAMFVTGIVTGMLRLNFAGAIFAAALFLSPRIVGDWRNAWKSLLDWCRVNWKRMTAYLLFIPLPSLLITFLYSLFIPHYTLSPSLNQQTSIVSIMESLMIVIIGGDMEFLNMKVRSDPAGLILTTLPIIAGLIIALISLVYRHRFWSAIDLRLSLFLISMLPVYAVLKPIAYFPRYSWSFLPPAMILIALLLQSIFLRDNKADPIIQEDK